MENLPPPQEKELPAPNEKLLRSPTFWEQQGKAAKWLAISSIILFVFIFISALFLKSQKLTTVTPSPALIPLSVPTIIPTQAEKILEKKLDIKVGTGESQNINIAGTQKSVDEGHQPWRLSPDMVLMPGVQLYGFTLEDINNINLKNVISEPGKKVYKIQHKTDFYLITVSQPVIGQNKIWIISEIKLDGIANLQVYRNEKYGFELTFPKDWYLPTASDDDPHFYATKECANSERPNCSALEIQNHDSEFSKGSEARLNTLKAYGQNPIKLPFLIPEAVVIKSNAPGPAEGWGIQYDIFFQTNKRNFLIFSNNEALEKDIIPTFKFLEPQK